MLSELESTLLNFCVIFKANILTESRMINIGHSMIEMPPDEEDPDSADGIYNVSTRALDCLANLAGH